MQEIPLIDIRDAGPRKLVDLYPDRANELICASKKTLGLFSELVSRALLPHGDRVSREWLVKTGNPYLEEIDDCAKKLNVSGIHALNVCFEWGCTSAVYEKEAGPTLTRVMDWMFPKLGENVIVALQSGKAGDFYNVTWPGVSGVFQGMAAGRFSASLNQAPMQRHNLGYLGDWAKNRKQVYDQNGLPPAHLLRMTFEEANNYNEAKERLCQTKIALPAIYILAGARPGEGCVIERTENEYAIRNIENDRACASNQFDSRLNATGHGWRPRRVDSAGRMRQAMTAQIASIDKEFSWLQSPVANPHTRLALVACPASGAMSVVGMKGKKRATQIFHIS